MADARKALAEVVWVTPLDRVPASQPAESPVRIWWPFLCSDLLAFVLGYGTAAIVATAFLRRVGLVGMESVPAELAMAPSRLAIGLVLGVGAAVIFSLLGHYSWRRASWSAFSEAVLTMGLLGALHLVTIRLAFPTDALAPVALGWMIIAALLVTGREAIKSRLAGSDSWLEPAVLVGNPERAAGVAETVSEDPDLALRITHIVDAGGYGAEVPTDVGSDGRGARPIGSDNAGIVFHLRRRTILFCPSPSDFGTIERFLQWASAANCRLGVVIPGAWPGCPVGRHHHMLADGSTLVWLPNRLRQPLWRVAKRSADIVGSALLLIAFAPLFAVLALPSLASGQPVLFAHRRVGQYGRRFTCYKFRTMIVGAEAVLQRLLAADENARKEWESSYKLKNDPRVTRFGAFLRRTSLDELPQLWNVLRGDMSLVGPRPIVDGEVRRYGQDAMTYFSVKPGITGLWQVSGRSDTSYDMRVAYDRWYVRNWTFGKDIAILMKTAWIVLIRTGAY